MPLHRSRKSLGWIPQGLGEKMIIKPSLNTLINWALASNGGTASASSTYDANYPASSTINGDRKGLNFKAGGGWNDATSGAWPDWIQVDFNGTKTISEIDVFTLQDAWQTPIEPTLSTTFTLYGNTAFTVQFWDGSAWTTVSGGSVTGNNKVWRQFSFTPVATTKVRVNITANANNDFSRVVELEAWGYQ
jgi:hypothetical protein